MSEGTFRTRINVIVNGTMHTVDVPNNITLLRFLRDELNLTGTKCGCEKGQCGACTVIIDGKSATSCLVLVASLEGKEVTTIEGLAVGGNLDPIQEKFIQNHALQCGFCTPGMIMSSKALLDRNPNPTEKEIRHELRGNLCRCGTYPNVFKSVLEVAAEMKEEG